ncbi:MAG: Fur family transcriptional regulator [Candidatus Latescibacterota bacterium]
MTRRKTAILREILGSNRPLNAAELHQRVSAALPIDLATVYRTLGALSKRGLLREISDGSGTLYYEIACVHNPVHPHFRCLQCRKITCLGTLTGESAAAVAKYAGGCEIEEISITLSGVCGDCRRGYT